MHDANRGTMELVVYSDFTCPFSYLADALLDRLRTDEAVAVEYRPWELWPAPVPLPESGEAEPPWDDVLLPLAETLGVELRRPEVRPRSRKAHEAAFFAREHGRLDAMRRAIFRAYFVDGRDIGRVDVLTELGESLDLDLTALKVALDIDQHTEAVVEAERRAERAGVQGVPTFEREDERLVGLQPYGRLLQFARGD